MQASGIWQAAGPGRVVALFTDDGRVPAAPSGTVVARAVCRPAEGALGPLEALRRQLDRLDGVRRGTRERVLDAGRQELRRRLLGEGGLPDPLATLATLVGRAAEARPGEQVALVLDHLERADADTLDVLLRLVARAEAWPVAVLLAVGPGPRDPRLDDLIGRLAARGAVMGAPRAATEGPRVPSLDPETLALLRIAAHLGPELQVDRLAEVLGLGELSVLMALQAAAEQGWPVQDLGGGRLRLPPALCEELAAGLLPSLAEILGRYRGPGQGPTEPTPESAVDAVRAYLDAAEQALGAGASREALAFADTARELCAELSDPEPARRWSARTLRTQARVLWAVAGSEDRPGHTVTLGEALQTAAAAHAALTPEDPVTERAEALVLLAGIHGMIGDRDSLAAALRELAQATRALVQAGEVLPAAALLNDQAAIWMRSGDPVRAAHLLQEAGRLFTSEGTTVAHRLEHAETQHLLARLALYTPARPGQEDDALARAVAHCEEAIETLRSLGQVRLEARVRETRGRLLGRQGLFDEAMGELLAMWHVLEDLGDAEGMARVAGALSEVLVEVDEPKRALDVLSRSIDLNRRIGARRGLEANRAALDTLVGRLRGDTPPALQERLDDCAAQLA